MADFSELAIANAWNRCLQDLSDRLETLGRSTSYFGLPEPVRELTEVEREWNHDSCQQILDTHLSLLSSDEQQIIFDSVMRDHCTWTAGARLYSLNVQDPCHRRR